MQTFQNFHDVDYHISRIKREMVSIISGTKKFQEMNELDHRNIKDLFSFISDIQLSWKSELKIVVNECSAVCVNKNISNTHLVCATHCGIYLNLGIIKKVNRETETVVLNDGDTFIYSGTTPIPHECFYRVARELGVEPEEITFMDSVIEN